LESLCIENALVTASLDKRQILHRFKTLKVHEGHANDAAFEFLSRQCPHLLELEFHFTKFASTCFNLPSHNLDLLNIDYLSSKELFVRVNQDGDIWLYYTDLSEYYPEEDDYMLYNGVKPVQPRDLSKEKVLDVICRSIHTIVICKHLAV
jgi:hypothetical protein